MIASTVYQVDWSAATAKLAERAPLEHEIATYNKAAEGNTVRPLGLALLGSRPDRDLGSDKDSLSTGYLLPFEIASVHLLVVLIGAAYLARAKRRVTPNETP